MQAQNSDGPRLDIALSLVFSRRRGKLGGGANLMVCPETLNAKECTEKPLYAEILTNITILPIKHRLD